ncbi:MAG TPA: enoyl-CoA hydratase-related protein, partial [Caulobacter sp.]|nr:enoyl-CoA hydratase-related protein [Caulobacter sp.]
MTNPIADPIVEVPDTDAMTPLVHLDSTPGGAVTVWINRPARKNAFDAATIAALHQAFETLHGAEGVRIVFLRGVGGAFSAGADLEWMKAAADWSEDDNREDALGLAQMLKALHDIPALTVALVEGP